MFKGSTRMNTTSRSILLWIVQQKQQKYRTDASRSSLSSILPTIVNRTSCPTSSIASSSSSFQPVTTLSLLLCHNHHHHHRLRRDWRSMVAFSSSPNATIGTSTSSTTGNPNGTNISATTTSSSSSNVFLDNIGTIFLSCIGLVIGALIRSHYGTKNKNYVRDYIEETSAIDPLEMNDLRSANSNITVTLFRDICKDVIMEMIRKRKNNTNSSTTVDPAQVLNGTLSTTESMIVSPSTTYADFTNIVRRTMMKRLQGEQYTIELGHLVDRVVISALERNGKSLQDEMPMMFWLTVLSMTVNCPAKDRISALFDMVAMQSSLEDEWRKDNDDDDDDDDVNITNDTMASEYNSSNDTTSPSTISSKRVTINDVCQIVGYLQDTCQLVPDAQVVPTTTKYPIQQYTIATPEQLVAWDENVENKNNKNESIKDDVTDTDGTPIIAENEQEQILQRSYIDLDAFSSILRSKSVCAWGECYHKYKSYQ